MPALYWRWQLLLRRYPPRVLFYITRFGLKSTMALFCLLLIPLVVNLPTRWRSLDYFPSCGGDFGLSHIYHRPTSDI